MLFTGTVDYLEKMKKMLETLSVSGQKNVEIMSDALHSLDVMIDILRHPPKVEETTTEQTIEVPVDPQLTGGDDHASDQ